MIPAEVILEVSAAMIVGILFVAAIARAMDWLIGTTLFLYCLAGVLPFSIAAILALLELNEASKWVCIIGFVLFASFLTFMSLIEAIQEK